MEKIFAQLLNIDESKITSYQFKQSVETKTHNYGYSGDSEGTYDISTEYIPQEPYYEIYIYSDLDPRYEIITLSELFSKMFEMLNELNNKPQTIIYSNSNLCD